jgi:iron(III) transport system substrate-binding protein
MTRRTDALRATTLARSPRTFRLVLLAGVVALAAAIAGCAGASGGSGKTLVLYSAQHPQTTAAIVAAFTKQTGIKVLVKNDGEDVLTAQLEQEGGRSPADVFYTENSNWLQQLGDRGMLAKVAGATLASIPRRDSATNGDWLGVSGRFSALIYNPSKIAASELPKTAMALASPKYKGKLELAPAETDFWPIVTSIARAHGQSAALAWLKGLKANAGSDDNTADNETLVSDVSKGVADMGLINHYYFFRIRSEVGAGSFHAKLSFFTPRDPGYVEDISAAGILKSSAHKSAAQKFLAFLASPAGQQVLAHSASYEYPLVKGVAPNPALPALSSFKPNSITPAEIGTGLGARNLLREAGLI